MHGIASGEHGEVIATSPVSGFGDLVSQDGRYQVTVATSEALDLFARSFAAGPKRTEIPSKLFRGSHPAIAADQTLDIDFDRDGVAPQTVALTVAGGGGEPVTIITSIVTSTATIQLARQRYEGTLPSDYLAPAVSQSAPGDLLQLHVTTLLDASGPAYAYRNADTYHAVAAAQTVELPAPWSVDPPTLTATGARRPAFVFPVAADAKPTQHYEAQVTANAQLDPSLPLDTRYSKVLISGRYAAGQLRFTFAAPDLSALAGWSDAMGLPAGTSVAWYILLAENDVASPSHASDGDFKSNTVVGGILPP
ncbi:MAG: hypothetical protein ABIY55_28140 [Kofleriaceae bacterium]